ncbi:AraC family transcriptional regulator [Paenibacillus sp. IB182496]|uniref:AraC family transcriptional regulator n=1 Tax=Paenibacillus sabuli TaxID=2772509 RepID=A0A927BUX6_9BACL|nr:AraC family transcriptional regulator [Paenibacillus sabuli]MBD2845959.1 AraC family transcriptional regulator [Paenibacillus sabuli]
MHKLMIRFFVPYLLILIVTHGISMYTYYHTLNVMERDVLEVNRQALEQTKNILDRRLSELEMIVSQLSNAPRVTNYQTVTEPFEGVSTYRTLELVKELYDYKQSNNFIADYYLYYQASDMVISANTSYRLPAFYSDIYGYTDLDAAQWREMLGDGYHYKRILPAREMDVRGKRERMVTYLHSIGMPHSSKGVVVILIRESEIRSLLARLVHAEEGRAYLAGADGSVIVSTAQEEIPTSGTMPMPELPYGSSGQFKRELDGKEATVNYTTSAHSDWTYVAMQPTSAVLDTVSAVQRTIWTTLLMSLAVGLLIAVYMAYRGSRPLRELVQRVRERFGGEAADHEARDAYGLIEGTLERLWVNKDELETKIEAQLPLLRFAFFERLLKGELVTQDEIMRMRQHAGVELLGGCSGVCVIQLDQRPVAETLQTDASPARLVRLRVLAKEALSGALPAGCHLHDLGGDKLALLYTTATDELERAAKEMEALVERIDRILLERLQMRCVLACGGVYAAGGEIARSCEEARRMLATAGYREEEARIVRHDGQPRNVLSYAYTTEQETRLLHLLKAGNTEEAGALLDRIERDNFHDRELSLSLLRLLLYNLGEVAMRLAELPGGADGERQRQLEHILLRLDEQGDPAEMFAALRELLLSVGREMHERKRSRNEGLRDRIVDYVRSSYANPELSLVLVAERFQLSEVYLSQFYKEQTGLNFSDDLERLRMNRVRELLAVSELSVGEIARQVGYNTASSFGRAFKRIHGMSATAYRKLRLEEKL